MSIDHARPGADAEEWLSVQSACSLLGVSPATLRRWSAAGEVQAYTTPGGHRRYARSTILGLLPDTGRSRPTLGELGATPERLARVIRRHLAPATRGAEWVTGLDEGGLGELRRLGRRIVAGLIAAIDADGPREAERAIAEASAAAAGYGRLAAAACGDPGETVGAFLEVRRLFVEELAQIARRQGLDTAAATNLVVDAVSAADRLLPALMAGLAVARVPA